MLLASSRVIFLAPHRGTPDGGRLPKPTADSGCDDKPVLRVGPGPARALHVYSRRGSVPPPALQEHRDSYIRTWGWGEPRGWGFSQALARAPALAGMRTHLLWMNIPACHSLAWNGLPPLAAITIPSRHRAGLTCCRSRARGSTPF